MLTSVFGISIKYEAWNHQDSLPVYIAGSYDFHTEYKMCIRDSDTHSELCDAIRIVKGYRKEKWGYFLRAESFYNFATQEEEYASRRQGLRGAQL